MTQPHQFKDRNDPGHEFGELIVAGLLMVGGVMSISYVLPWVFEFFVGVGVDLSPKHVIVIVVGVFGLYRLIDFLLVRAGKRVRGGSRPGLRAYSAMSDALGTRYTLYGLICLARGETIEDDDDEDDNLDIDIEIID